MHGNFEFVHAIIVVLKKKNKKNKTIIIGESGACLPYHCFFIHIHVNWLVNLLGVQSVFVVVV